jgi:hypothetical protein
MPRRDSIPLHKSRMAKFIEAAHSHNNPHKSLISLLALGTGVRNITLGHIHEDWFFYEDGGLWLEIPPYEECRKDPNADRACGDCRDNGHDHYEPKTPAAAGRILLIHNHYSNHNEGERTGEEQYFGLRDMVERYFALSDSGAPDDVQHGYKMIGTNGTGISRNTVNTWIRDVAAHSEIKSPRRARRIRKEIVDDNENKDEGESEAEDEDKDEEWDGPVKMWGKDDGGNHIPDLFCHDLRASYVTQMMRNEVPPTKAIEKTGHKDPDSMKPYVMFAIGEISKDEEEDFF